MAGSHSAREHYHSHSQSSPETSADDKAGTGRDTQRGQRIALDCVGQDFKVKSVRSRNFFRLHGSSRPSEELGGDIADHEGNADSEQRLALNEIRQPAAKLADVIE